MILSTDSIWAHWAESAETPQHSRLESNNKDAPLEGNWHGGGGEWEGGGGVIGQKVIHS